MRKMLIKRIGQFLVCLLFCSVLATAQKNEEPAREGITLADLGVTPEQKSQIETMWKLKRQKHLQAVNDLKTLNRYVKDTLISEKEIKETLKKFRVKRKEMQDKINKAEDVLIKTLPPKAQLHLTVLGILDNGLPRRTMKTQIEKKKEEKKEGTAIPIEQKQNRITE